MKAIISLISLFYIFGLYSTNFDSIMEDLVNLEKYIRQYKEEKGSTQTITHLITCYIRKGGYDSNSWSIAGGSIPDDLPQYIIDKDTSEGTNAQKCMTYREIDLPNDEKIDFVHFFAVMNGIENGGSFSKNFAHLVGWGGDTFQLLQDIKNNEGDLDELMNVAKAYFRIKGGFGLADFISDLDAPIILNSKTDNNYFSDIIKNYYNSNKYLNRVNNFVELTFPSLESKDKFREELFNKYSTDTYIKILECQDGIREGSIQCMLPGKLKPQYENHQKAAVYVVSDYLSENYNEDLKPEEEEEEEDSDKEEEEGNKDNGSNFIINLSFVYLFILLIMIL